MFGTVAEVKYTGHVDNVNWRFNLWLVISSRWPSTAYSDTFGKLSSTLGTTVSRWSRYLHPPARASDRHVAADALLIYPRLWRF